LNPIAPDGAEYDIQQDIRRQKGRLSRRKEDENAGKCLE
jgi:hypothetical protein